jgi:hypothetical protein
MELHPPNRELFRLHCRNEFLITFVVVESQRNEKLTQIFILSETFFGDPEHVIKVHNLVFLEVEFHPI